MIMFKWSVTPLVSLSQSLLSSKDLILPPYSLTADTTYVFTMAVFAEGSPRYASTGSVTIRVLPESTQLSNDSLVFSMPDGSSAPTNDTYGISEGTVIELDAKDMLAQLPAGAPALFRW